MPSEAHTVVRVECPVTCCVAKVDLIDKEAQRKGAAFAEKVVLVTYMNVPHI